MHGINYFEYMCGKICYFYFKFYRLLSSEHGEEKVGNFGTYLPPQGRRAGK